MRKIIDFLIKNIHSLTFAFLLLLSITQIIDKNYYHSSKFNFFSNSLVNIINEEKQNLVEYFELKEINENLINENNFLRNNYSIGLFKKNILRDRILFVQDLIYVQDA